MYACFCSMHFLSNKKLNEIRSIVQLIVIAPLFRKRKKYIELLQLLLQQFRTAVEFYLP